MESGPPLALLISFRCIYCPIPMKIAIGRIQVRKNVRTGDACSIICPEKAAPESYSLCVRSGSFTIPVL